MQFLPVYIKYLFILLSSFYLFPKLLHIPFSKKGIGVSLLFSCVLPFPYYYARINIPVLSLFFLVSAFLIIMLYLYHTAFNTALITSVISIGLSFFLFTVATVVMSPLFLTPAATNKNAAIYQTILQLAVSVCQLLLTLLPFRIRRLKNGMPFLHQQDSNDIGAFISLLLLLAVSLSKIRIENDLIFALSIFFTAICGLLLFFWWRKRLTQKYIETLQKNEFEYLTKEIADLQEQVQKLKGDNENMSKIIHKDNKLIPAMNLAVNEMLALHLDPSAKPSAGQDKSSRLDELTALSKQLELLSKDRKGILRACENMTAGFAPTGLARFDALLRYMEQKAFDYQAEFCFSPDADIRELTAQGITEDDLCTLTADLTENAFIACKNRNQQSGKVLLDTVTEDGYFCLRFFDNGIPFVPAIISKLGKKRITTHADSGGSGIGMMTAFEITHKYNASLCIDHASYKEIYSKKVSVCFDGRNEFRAEGKIIE